jgi:hypothetical protein
MMFRRTSSWIELHAPRPRFSLLARKAIGLAIFLSGSAVIVVYLLRRA